MNLMSFLIALDCSSEFRIFIYHNGWLDTSNIYYELEYQDFDKFLSTYWLYDAKVERFKITEFGNLDVYLRKEN